VPLYEYECKKCGHRFEKIMKFSDEPVKVCPKCSGEVEQMVSAPAVQFKGSGWYVTDYAKKSGSGAPKAAAGDSSNSSSSEKKTEGGAAASETPKSSASETKSAPSEKRSDSKD
jgi:putative FmdB family regulatory protein